MPRKNGNGNSKSSGNGAAKKRKDEQGRYVVGAHVWAKYNGDNSFRDCEVIEVEVSKKDERVRYYVHYVEFNRRMDTWVKASEVFDTNPENPDAKLSVGHVEPVALLKEKKANKDVVEFVEEEYGENAGMDEASIREHEEVTKVKNVNKLELGRHMIDTWYFSPIPKDYYPDGPIDVLYFCEFSLNFYRFKEELTRHYMKCHTRYPPGDEIYRDEESKVSMFELDGAKSKIYCQNLCYLAKFFLDHKTLHYDVDPFLFYVLCEYDARGYHIVGFFSKEKYSEQGYNLVSSKICSKPCATAFSEDFTPYAVAKACILTLPPYQRKGYGKFLISFSYELSKKEKKVGSPEKPLSDLGQVSYRSYWQRAILEELQHMHGAKATSVIDLTKATSIKTEDVILTLNYLGFLKFQSGQYVLSFTKETLDERLRKLKVKGLRFKSDCLHWAPLVVDIKRDKWSIRSKRKADVLAE